MGIFFALGGIALFAWTLRKDAPEKPGAPVKKSELREQEVRQAENTKLRIAAAIAVVVGAAMMVFS